MFFSFIQKEYLPVNLILLVIMWWWSSTSKFQLFRVHNFYHSGMGSFRLAVPTVHSTPFLYARVEILRLNPVHFGAAKILPSNGEQRTRT